MKKNDTDSSGNAGRQIRDVAARLNAAFLGILSLFLVIVTLAVFLGLRWQSLDVITVTVTLVLLLWSVAVMFYSFDSVHRASAGIRERLEKLAFMDELTGIYNYRYLDTRMKEEGERVRRYGGSAALLYMDLLKFKLVNDKHGHETGNLILAEVAQLMSRTLRSCDILGRAGGDEFLAILPETDCAQAGALAERLRSKIEEYYHPLRSGSPIDFLHLSVGIAALPENGAAINEVLRAADAALYEAKAKGGNCVCVAQKSAGQARAEHVRLPAAEGKQDGGESN